VEQGLCSSKSEFVALSPKFVCVRLYYTVKGASEPFVKFGLGSPKGPRNNVDLAFLAPDGRNIDVRTLKPVSWTGAAVGGHHREGVLAFDVPAPRPGAIELRIDRPGESVPRIFRWQL